MQWTQCICPQSDCGASQKHCCCSVWLSNLVQRHRPNVLNDFSDQELNSKNNEAARRMHWTFNAHCPSTWASPLEKSYFLLDFWGKSRIDITTKQAFRLVPPMNSDHYALLRSFRILMLCMRHLIKGFCCLSCVIDYNIGFSNNSASCRQMQPELIEGLDKALANIDPSKVTSQLILKAFEHAPGLVAQLQQVLDRNTDASASILTHTIQQPMDTVMTSNFLQIWHADYIPAFCRCIRRLSPKHLFNMALTQFTCQAFSDCSTSNAVDHFPCWHIYLHLLYNKHLSSDFVEKLVSCSSQ